MARFMYREQCTLVCIWKLELHQQKRVVPDKLVSAHAKHATGVAVATSPDKINTPLQYYYFKLMPPC